MDFKELTVVEQKPREGCEQTTDARVCVDVCLSPLRSGLASNTTEWQPTSKQRARVCGLELGAPTSLATSSAHGRVHTYYLNNS